HVGEGVALPVAGKLTELFLSDPVGPAHGRADVQSERTAHQGSRLDLGQRDDLAIDPMGARQPRLEAQAGLEDLGMSRLQPPRFRDGGVPGSHLLVDDPDLVAYLAFWNAWDARHHVLSGASRPVEAQRVSCTPKLDRRKDPFASAAPLQLGPGTARYRSLSS